jgi:hypothetical protein
MHALITSQKTATSLAQPTGMPSHHQPFLPPLFGGWTGQFPCVYAPIDKKKSHPQYHALRYSDSNETYEILIASQQRTSLNFIYRREYNNETNEHSISNHSSQNTIPCTASALPLDRSYLSMLASASHIIRSYASTNEYRFPGSLDDMSSTHQVFIYYESSWTVPVQEAHASAPSALRRAGRATVAARKSGMTHDCRF